MCTLQSIAVHICVDLDMYNQAQRTYELDREGCFVPSTRPSGCPISFYAVQREFVKPWSEEEAELISRVVNSVTYFVWKSMVL